MKSQEPRIDSGGRTRRSSRAAGVGLGGDVRVRSPARRGWCPGRPAQPVRRMTQPRCLLAGSTVVTSVVRARHEAGRSSRGIRAQQEAGLSGYAGRHRRPTCPRRRFYPVSRPEAVRVDPSQDRIRSLRQRRTHRFEPDACRSARNSLRTWRCRELPVPRRHPRIPTGPGHRCRNPLRRSGSRRPGKSRGTAARALHVVPSGEPGLLVLAGVVEAHGPQASKVGMAGTRRCLPHTPAPTGR